LFVHENLLVVSRFSAYLCVSYLRLLANC